MGFLNTNSMPRLVEKLADGDNIKITGNSKGNRVGTVIKKIVEKADDVTKAVEQEVVNDSYSFKVGTGDVDVSVDVEDGFGEVGVKGVTYQNILKSFDDSKWTGNHIEKNGNQCKLTQNSNREYLRFRTNLIKKNTKYTLIYTVTENTMVDLSLCINGENVSSGENCIDSNIYIPNVLGTHIVTFTSSSLSDKTIKYFRFAIRSTTEDGTYVVLKNPILLEGDHTNNPNLPSYFEGIVGVGDKSKNLFNGKTRNGYYSNGVFTANSSNLANAEPIKIKPNTYYSGSGDALPRTTFYDKDMNFISYHTTTPILSPSNACYLNIHAMGATYFQIEEGSVATSYEPYYGGHKIEILSNGKNLWNGEFEVGSIDTVTGLNSSAGVNRKRSFFIRVNPNTKYMIKQYDYKDSNDAIFIHQYTLDKHPIEGFTAVDSSKLTLWTSNNTHFIKFRTQNERDLKYNSISITQEEKDTEFCEYVSDKTQILLDEPLMRLPNGVCDEITRDGKLIRRVGKVVVDSSSDIRILNEQEMDDTAYCNIHRAFINEFSRKHHTPMISNIMPYNPLWNCDNEGVNGDHETLSFRVKKSKLSELTSTAFKEYLLSKNPVVYYQLAEPIVTELPAPYLRIFKDGHLIFNTLVAPESNHVVQLNKSAQIERSIREVQGLDSRVEQLESFYDDMMLETSHKLNLLTYDFEYTKESEDI